MLSQDFDSSEFDYLNAGDFAQAENQTENQSQKQKAEITDIERFWKISGNWGKFGGYFSTGLAASLIVRGIPVLIPAAVIFFPAISLGVGLYSLSVEGRDKTRCQLILLAIGTALLSAKWDAWLAWVVANSQQLIFGFALTVIVLGFVAVQVWSKLNAGN
jgi:ABC-type multidrug transport system permease subunit